MRKNRLYEEKLLVNGPIGGQNLSKHERQTLQDEAAELKQAIEESKQQDIAE
ncbi:hypothetical protein [Brevibacillus daliensis]|uniref:hypothetical protein n=1 Tax=Brevibacillus daliensis TaxID=2892995 RepID=UPI001E41200C|nr:hypothetical protein [Brevibacillus daliensis]